MRRFGKRIQLVAGPVWAAIPNPETRSVSALIGGKNGRRATHREPWRESGLTARAEKVWLHSTGDASPLHPNAAAALGTPLAALLLAQMLPVFSVVAPCHRGSPVSVRRQTFTTAC